MFQYKCYVIVLVSTDDPLVWYVCVHIKVLFGVEISGGPRHIMLDGGHDLPVAKEGE